MCTYKAKRFVIILIQKSWLGVSFKEILSYFLNFLFYSYTRKLDLLGQTICESGMSNILLLKLVRVLFWQFLCTKLNVMAYVYLLQNIYLQLLILILIGLSWSPEIYRTFFDFLFHFHQHISPGASMI